MTNPHPPLPGGSAWHLAVAIDGHGQHPAAWRAVADADPTGLFDGAIALRHALLAESGDLSFVTLDDALSLQHGGPELVRGRVDALLTMAKLGPLTSTIGLVPTVTTTHTEPFHVSKNVATLDWVSGGRGGWRVAVSTSAQEAEHFGRTAPATLASLHAEAADAVEAVRRLWDSWEDDAIIRDQPTGRFIDREKVHYIDFEGKRFSVRGPSIVPRSPQGQPLVVVDTADGSAPSATILAAVAADIVFIDALDADAAARQRASVLDAVTAAGRDPREVTVMVHLDVLVGGTSAAATGRLADLDAMAEWTRPAARARFVGDADQLVAALHGWAAVVDGVHLRPAVLQADLTTIVERAVPALREAGLVRPATPGATLRDRFALPRPVSRYAGIGH